jgi:hypothetical protein
MDGLSSMIMGGSPVGALARAGNEGGRHSSDLSKEETHLLVTMQVHVKLFRMFYSPCYAMPVTIFWHTHPNPENSKQSCGKKRFFPQF